MLEEDVVVDNEVDESVFGGGEFVIGGGELNKVSGFGFVDPPFAPLLERLESVWVVVRLAGDPVEVNCAVDAVDAVDAVVVLGGGHFTLWKIAKHKLINNKTFILMYI